MTKLSRYTLTKVEANAVPVKFVLGAVTSNLESTLYFSMEKKDDKFTLNVEYQDPSKERELADFLVSLKGYDFSYELIDYNTITAREIKSRNGDERGSN